MHEYQDLVKEFLLHLYHILISATLYFAYFNRSRLGFFPKQAPDQYFSDQLNSLNCNERIFTIRSMHCIEYSISPFSSFSMDNVIECYLRVVKVDYACPIFLIWILISRFRHVSRTNTTSFTRRNTNSGKVSNVPASSAGFSHRSSSPWLRRRCVRQSINS